MGSPPRVLITGSGAVCAAGDAPNRIWDAVCSGRTAVGPIRQWDTNGWPRSLAGEVADFNARALVPDRKVHKLLRRTDFFGVYAAERAIEAAALQAHRAALDEEEAQRFDDRTGIYVGSGGSAYQNQYDFLPLLHASAGNLQRFGHDCEGTVDPLWLLRTLPNNVLCHLGIRHGFKGPNLCITNHGVSGALAIVEAMAALRAGEADRAVAVGHDAPIEPQVLRYFHALDLLAVDALRPFDAGRSGTVIGEGAAAVVVETEASATARAAVVLGEVLGAGCAGDARGVLAIRPDGEGLVHAITRALEDGGITAADVGMIVAHGNGTQDSDASEASAIRRVFGRTPPPVTALKWAFGHLMAAAGTLEAVVALDALRHGVVPGVATLQGLDAACAELPISAAPQPVRSDIGLVLSRGFAGMNVALVLRAAAAGGGR